MAQAKANSNVIEKLDKAKHTRMGYAISSLIEGALAFAAATWAIDSGSMWAYLFASVFTIGSLHNLFKGLTFRNGKK